MPNSESLRKAGKLLAHVRNTVLAEVKPGVSFESLEALAMKEIQANGAQPSFPTVSRYSWATCITKNQGCCHGIPKNQVVQHGDIITIDVGLILEGYHVDTAATVCAGTCSQEIETFLFAGKKALTSAIQAARSGNSVFDISLAMQYAVESSGYRVVYQLTGHGIGHKLHLPPNIPCFADKRNKKDKLFYGQMLAIEVMYTLGNPTLVLGEDGWTYETKDKKLSAMFEHTIQVTHGDAKILTKSAGESPLEKNR